MGIIFPLNLSEFFEPLGKVSAVLSLDDPRTQSRSRGGEIITMDGADPLWFGSVELQVDYTSGHREAEARIDVLKQSGASFLVTDGRQRGPASDPDGVIIGAASPQISAVASTRYEIDISGLPANFQLRIGDLFSYTHGSGTTRYQLHRIIRSATADGSGNISGLDVFPEIRPGVTGGTALTFVDPVCEAVMRPGSFSPGVHRPVLSQGHSFEFVQFIG